MQGGVRITLDFEEVRNIQRKEKNSSSLVEIPDDFYSNLAIFVQEKTTSYQSSRDSNEFRTLENVIRLSRDIFDKREQKILKKALTTVRTNEYDDSRLIAGEKKLYSSLVDSLGVQRKFFSKVLLGEAPVPGNTVVVEKKEETFINEENNNLVLVRALKMIPIFVGSDNKEYGPFESSDVVKIPASEAELLIKQELIEKL